MRFYYASVELRAHKGRVRWADHRPNPFAVRPWSVGEPWARGITPATGASLTVLLSSKRCSRGSTCDATVNDVVGAEVLADDPVVVDGVLSTAPTGVIPLAGRAPLAAFAVCPRSRAPRSLRSLMVLCV